MLFELPLLKTALGLVVDRKQLLCENNRIMVVVKSRKQQLFELILAQDVCIDLHWLKLLVLTCIGSRCLY